MEEWEVEFEWLRVRHLVKKVFDRDQLPDLNAILYLIGIQELGRWQTSFTKEEKQDLMHIAVCKLLSLDGFFEFQGRDADGWPHWKQVRSVSVEGVKEQGEMLKHSIIRYFEEWRKENPHTLEEEQ